jgi:protein-S-isoprenylcysteine O-methyltransferase Ste14
MPLAHGILPWALSWLAHRYGWSAGYPGTWNWLGLIPIAAGAALLIWIFASGLARARELPEQMQLLAPPFLMTTGPYAYTRNPGYVAELALWLGWATLFGSLVVLIGFVVLAVVIILILPWEARGLETQFGETYRQYQARVSRWVGRRAIISPEVPASKRSHRTRISRRMVFIFSVFVVSVVYPFNFGVLPWLLSLLTPRIGWTEHGPAAWNILGLLPVVAVALGLVWLLPLGFAQFRKLPPVVELDEEEGLLTATPRVLITDGPFAYSRNPTYLAGTFVLLGWALFYGSVVILILAVAGWTLLHYLKVPREERGLEARFGEAYRTYRSRVPRWIGMIRRE